MIKFDEGDYFGMAPHRQERPPVKRVKTPYPTPKQIRDNLLLPPLRVDTELSEASTVFDRCCGGSEITDVSSVGEREHDDDDDDDHEVDGKVKVGVVEADSGVGGSSTAGSSSMGAVVESKGDGGEVGILEGGEGEAAIDEIGEEEEEEPKSDAVIKGYNCCRCSTYNQIPLSTASIPLAGATDNTASSSSVSTKSSKDRRNINIPFRAQSPLQKCSCGHKQCRRRCRIEWRISHKQLAEQRMLKGNKRICVGKKVTTKDGKKKEEVVENDGLRWGWCTKEFLDKVDRNWDEDGNRRLSLGDGGVQAREKSWRRLVRRAEGGIMIVKFRGRMVRKKVLRCWWMV